MPEDGQDEGRETQFQQRGQRPLKSPAPLDAARLNMSFEMFGDYAEQGRLLRMNEEVVSRKSL